MATRSIVFVLVLCVAFSGVNDSSAFQNTSTPERNFAAAYAKAAEAWRAGRRSFTEQKAGEAMELAEREFGPRSPQRLNAMDLVVSSRNSLRKYADAEPLAREALKIRSAVEGADSIASLNAATRLGNCLIGLGKFAEAERILLEAKARHDKVVVEPGDVTLDLHGNLGVALLQNGKPAAAEKIFRQHIPLFEKLRPTNLEGIAYVNERMANALHKQTRHAEAEPYVRRTLEVRRKNASANPTRQSELRVAVSVLQLGLNLHEQAMKRRQLERPVRREMLKDAEKHIRESLAIRRRLQVSENDPSISRCTFALALVLEAQTKRDAADPLFRKYWATRHQYDDAKTPEALNSLRSLVKSMQDRAPMHEWEPFVRRSIALHGQALGESHPMSISQEERLARKLDHKTRFIEALEIRHRILNRVRLLYGENSDEVAEAYHGIGITLSYQNNNAEAEYFIRKAADIARRLGQVGTITWGSRLHSRAIVLAQMGRSDEAIDLAREAVAIHQRRASERLSNPTLMQNSLAVILGDGKSALK